MPELTEEATLEDVAFQYAETNTISQVSSALREDLQKSFRSLVDQELEGELANKTIEIPDDIEDAKAYAERYHGDWSFVSEKDGKALLIEKASSRPFSITVTDEDEDGNLIPVENNKGEQGFGFVVSRNVRTKTPEVDYDRLKEDVEFYERITDPPVVPPYVLEVFHWLIADDVSNFDQQKHKLQLDSLKEDWLATNPQPRVLKDDLSVEDIARLRNRYLISPPSTQVVNVRLAKEDEV